MAPGLFTELFAPGLRSAVRVIPMFEMTSGIAPLPFSPGLHHGRKTPRKGDPRNAVKLFGAYLSGVKRVKSRATSCVRSSEAAILP